MTSPASGFGAYEDGWVADEVSADFPALGLVSLPVTLDAKPDARLLKDRMTALEAYVSGQVVRELASRHVTGAYRVFFRQIGLDPDQTPTPLERRLAQRILEGRFKDRGLLSSALTIATVETEVPIYALDAAAPLGPLGLSVAREGESLGQDALDATMLVVADITRPLAMVQEARRRLDPQFPFAAGDLALPGEILKRRRVVNSYPPADQRHRQGTDAIVRALDAGDPARARELLAPSPAPAPPARSSLRSP